MPIQVSKWKADDGSLWDSESEAVMHDELEHAKQEIREYFETIEKGSSVPANVCTYACNVVIEDIYKFASMLAPISRHT